MSKYQRCKQLAESVNKYLEEGGVVVDKSNNVLDSHSRFMFNDEDEEISFGVPLCRVVYCGSEGWGRFCSKSCKAKNQEERTGQNRAHLDRINKREDNPEEHPFSCEGLGQWV